MDMDSPLTMTGLVATIFGMIFALAAFITTRRKQAHKTAQMALHTDGTIVPEGQDDQHHLTDTQLVHSGAAEGSSKRPLAVFKQVGPKGTEVTPAAHYADDEYIWE